MSRRRELRFGGLDLKTQTIRERLLTGTMIGGVAMFAAAIVPAATVLVAPTNALAQASATQGAIAANVRDTSGAAVAGATVTVTSTDQGFSRTFTTDASGAFRAVALPQGNYTIAISAPGYNAFSDNVDVSVGGTSSFTFTIGRENATTVGDIVVVGTRRAVSEFDATTTGLSVNVEQLTANTPIARSGTALALLAPGVTAGDAAFGGIPAISGSSAGENTFFVNGLNTTDFVSFLGGASVPFEFYETFDVKTGGYSAEFGRGTGGVINATTKSGGNEWKFGLTSYWEPESLREYQPNTYLALNENDYRESWDVILEAGGPIISDRLFAYGLYNVRNREAYDQNTSGLGFRTKDDTPVYGGKVDFIIADGHRLEGTYFTDHVEQETEQTTFFANNAGSRSDGVYNFESGGDNYVFRYTGVWTDWLTTSLSYGVTENRTVSSSPEDGNPVIIDITGFDYNGDGILDVENTLTAQRGNWLIGSPGTNDDRREMLRFDVDAYVSLFGQHHFRAGIDNEDLEASQTLSRSGSGFNICRSSPINTATNEDALVCSGERTGGVAYRYQTPFTAANAPAGRPDLIGSPRRVRVEVYDNSGSWTSTQNAWYVQDSWEVTDRLTLNLGVRGESFENANINGETFVDIKNQIAPRLGATFDVFGDRQAKLFGFYGRYYLPVAVNTNQRLAGRELYFRDTYNLNVLNGNLAIDANQDGIRDDNEQPILGSLFSEVTLADGTTKPIATQVASNLDPMYVDEFIIGYSQRFGGYTAGVTATYRDLGRAIDDIAIDSALQQYCEQAGGGLSAASCAGVWSGFHQYVLANPGEDVTVTLAGSDLAAASGGLITQDRVVDLAADDLRFPKPVREYKAVEFSLERAFDGVWGGRVSYVWSDLEGNYEGALKSDNGQADPGLTQDYDVPGLADGAFGKLPNHREHAFKAYGNWQVTPNFNIGANILIESPRQFGCQGVHPETDPNTDDDLFAAFYGAASWYCDLDGDGTSEATPRGSVFKSDWLKVVDLTFAYTLRDRWGIPGDGVTLRADVFNIFNQQAELDFNEFGEIDIGAYPGPGQVNPNFGKVTAYQTPRYVRLSASVKF
ncbi:MAG: TonB-dependent receptor [Brevundimonas aurantiaca]|uniref:Outer membrane receptor protein involved in Fe transport n=1 Tax=Brevundimonas aurantiaca TaxID=74316 RepID=A0A7W9C3P2_9CAUL|nr:MULTISPECIES: TonB-dependent receptor [Brevundimonas]MBB5738364.1 outer membrane receptor protein involved in Fe transport [Brevundimonas aurantiaca]MBJ7509805.1 TonB-dependent receptor [Brevundimonas sp.]